MTPRPVGRPVGSHHQTGACPSCQQEHSLTNAGRIWKHHVLTKSPAGVAAWIVCPGSGQAPTP
jgi:hypothetical protein